MRSLRKAPLPQPLARR